MKINIEEKLPYTLILLERMKEALKEKKDLTVTSKLIKAVFKELGLE